MTTSWNAAVKDLDLLCQIAHPDDRPELGVALLAVDGLSLLAPDGSVWTRFRLDFDGLEIYGALFVRRLVLSLVAEDEARQSLGKTLEVALARRPALQQAADLLIAAVGGSVLESRSYLVVNCRELERKSLSGGKPESTPGWLDDGMTTFALRAFDSRRNRVGVIRVSRHLTVTYGLADGLITDLNNLIYERILYGAWPPGPKEVFSLLSALGDYVLPTEVSLYTHRIAQRLAAFGVAVGILFAATLSLQGAITGADSWQNVAAGLILLYLGFTIAAGGIWWLLGRVGASIGDH